MWGVRQVTHTALATADVVARLTPPGGASRFRRFIQELLEFFASTYKSVFGFASPPLHDPCAVAFVINPALFQAPPSPPSLFPGSIFHREPPCFSRSMLEPHATLTRTTCVFKRIQGRP